MITKTASNPPDARRIALAVTTLFLAAIALCAGQARAQILDAAELEDLVAPIALYPDDVLAVILPASTFPLDIVRAARFLDELETDPSLQPDESWDDSIVAMLNYPDVLRMMNDDIDWTWALGEAVLTDQAAVLAAAQDFRRRAYAAGNLQSDNRQIITESAEVIEIRPRDPDVVYIPVYEPREVIVYRASPYRFRYYPIGYPVYYYPYPAGYAFDAGFFWGVTSYFSIGWHSHFVHVHHHSHRLHPYYLNSYYYYEPYYFRRNVNITVNVNNYDNVWRPSPRRGARPRTETFEGRVSTVRSQRTSTVETQPGAVTRSGAVSTRTGAAGTTGTTTRGATGTTTRAATTEVRGGGTNSTTRRITSGQASGTAGRDTAVIGGRVEGSTRSTGSTGSPSGTTRTDAPRTRLSTGAPNASSQRSGGSTRSSAGSTRSSSAIGGVRQPATSSAPRVQSSTRSSSSRASAPSSPSRAAAPSRSSSSRAASPAPRSGSSAPASTRTSSSAGSSTRRAGGSRP